MRVTRVNYLMEFSLFYLQISKNDFCINRGIFCHFSRIARCMGACYQSSSRILVWIFKYFGSQKSTSFTCLQSFGYILVHLLCDCFVQVAVHSTINYYIILAIFSTFCSVFTQFLPITPTFFLTIFVYNYSLSTIFAIFLCHHCLHFYQDGMFVLDFSSRLCLFAVSLGQFLY